MRHLPTFEQFAELAREATVVPVYRQLIGDTLTPVSAFCKIQEGDWAFLFESVVGGERVGRYSFLGSGPFLRFQAFGNRVQIQQADPAPGGAARPPALESITEEDRQTDEREPVADLVQKPAKPGVHRSYHLTNRRERPPDAAGRRGVHALLSEL